MSPKKPVSAPFDMEALHTAPFPALDFEKRNERSMDGEWYVFNADSDSGDPVAEIDPDNIMADLGHDPMPYARLFAAAPDLLVALKYAEQRLSHVIALDHAGELVMIRAAISKAEGTHS